HKIDAIELDVHLSKDGVLIVHHDPVVMNEKGVKVPIREHYADYLSTLFIDGYQHIPTFKEVLLLIKETCDYPLTLFVEIKVDERNRRYPDIEDKVLSLLTETDLSDSSWILSFDFPTLIDVKAKNEKIHTSALISKTYLTSVGSKGVDKVISDMKSLKVSSVSVKDIYLTQTLIDALHKENLLVGVWTVNKEKDMKVFKEMKVDVITSDNPLLLRETLNIY
ncbi:MAG: glycerophosphodiester phosphodiesterase, partial [Spirochaetia bacterium]|nr:glycerophosphodiester phosphodiesterase [Spirochaetia bacterium]